MSDRDEQMSNRDEQMAYNLNGMKRAKWNIWMCLIFIIVVFTLAVGASLMGGFWNLAWIIVPAPVIVGLAKLHDETYIYRLHKDMYEDTRLNRSDPGEG
ncbi:MAG: hypothetical protein EB168_10980 [Euryarchaeota archaeon]|nr:hypothetical protein [Euryarchaeota archaeon]